MKRVIALILAVALCLGLCACSNNKKEEAAKAEAERKAEDAFHNSKAAFENVTEAYLEVVKFAEDVYEAWRLGINESSFYRSESKMSAFAGEMNIDLESIKKGVASLLERDSYKTGDWELLSYAYGGDYFSAWVSVISEAYKCSGKTAAIEKNLLSAKEMMKKMDEEYSDYVHYPSLKKYFTNAIAFLDFCRNPEGSFEQVKETINTYRNNAREYFFDLNYVFGDDIGGMKKEESK